MWPYRFWKPEELFLPVLAKDCVIFFFVTASNEVIVCFPTGGFLGDSSLSAKLWRKPQFLPAEWKVKANMWIHVGNCVPCPVCVHTCVSQVTKVVQFKNTSFCCLSHICLFLSTFSFLCSFAYHLGLVCCFYRRLCACREFVRFFNVDVRCLKHDLYLEAFPCSHRSAWARFDGIYLPTLMACQCHYMFAFKVCSLLQ